MPQFCILLHLCRFRETEKCLADAGSYPLHAGLIVHLCRVHLRLLHRGAHQIARRKVARSTAERDYRELAHTRGYLFTHRIPVIGADEVMMLHDLCGARRLNNSRKGRAVSVIY